MKKKYVITLAIVGCLIAVLGLSYAYFTSSINQNGDGKGSVVVNTVELNDTSFQIEGLLEFKDLDIYPGHKNVSSIKVTATGKNTIAAYNLIWNGINTLNTSLKYYVYESEEELNPSITCSKKEEGNSVSKIYYEECTNNNFESLGSIISEGEITSRATDEETIILPKQVIKGTEKGTIKYYYVVLEYPNLSESQNIDMGGTFKGEVTIKKADIKADTSIMAVYLEQDDGTYKESSEIPQEGYGFNEEKSVCNNGAVPTWVNNGLFVSDLTQGGTECYLYFDKGLTISNIIANLSAKIEIPDFSKIATTDEGVYAVGDGTYGGTSYYWRGAVTNNYVKFGGYCWRIVRINGDETMRLIYDGIVCHANGTSTMDSIAISSQYNISSEYSEFVGWTYEEGKQRTLLGTNSIAKTQLEDWYKTNLLDYTSKIADGKYCNDRNTAPGHVWRSTASSNIFYATNYRLDTEKNPTLSCSNSGDIYILKVGLITADEVAYAGGTYLTESNTNYYLYNGQNYWTMSPSHYYGYGGVGNRYPLILDVTSNGYVYYQIQTKTYGLRPVINLKADTQFSSGNGTLENPFVVK